MMAHGAAEEDLDKLNAADFCLEICHLELGMQGKIDFNTICKVPNNAVFVLPDSEEQVAESKRTAVDPNSSLPKEKTNDDRAGTHSSTAEVEEINVENNKVVIMLPSDRAKSLLINDSQRANRDGSSNREGIKMLRKAFWAVQKCRIDHFGKIRVIETGPRSLTSSEPRRRSS